MLDEANSFHPNIKLVRQVGTSVSFLDVCIENKNGILATSVYILLFKSDHSRHVFNNIIEGALMRAIRYSSTLFAFNEERLLIKLMLLYNGLVFAHLLSLIFYFFSFSLKGIHRDTSILDSKNSLPTNYHQHRSYLRLPIRMIFLFVRSYILNRPTVIEHQLTSRIAKTTDPLENDTINDPLVRMRLKKLSNSDRNLIVHYTHEARLGTYQKTY
jgi:hypothetical protein